MHETSVPGKPQPMMRSVRPADLHIHPTANPFLIPQESPSKQLFEFEEMIRAPLTPLFHAPIFSADEQMAMDTRFQPFTNPQGPPAPNAFQVPQIPLATQAYAQEPFPTSEPVDIDIFQLMQHQQFPEQYPQQHQHLHQRQSSFDNCPLALPEMAMFDTMSSPPPEFEVFTEDEDIYANPDQHGNSMPDWIETPESRVFLSAEETRKNEAILKKRFQEVDLGEFQKQYIQNALVRGSDQLMAKNTKACTECNIIFSNVGRYAFHYHNHGCKKGSKGVDREFCTEIGCAHATIGFCTRQSLLRHRQSVHGTKKKSQCYRCLRVFSRKDGLTRHLNARCCQEVPRAKEAKITAAMDALARKMPPF